MSIRHPDWGSVFSSGCLFRNIRSVFLRFWTQATVSLVVHRPMDWEHFTKWMLSKARARFKNTFFVSGQQPIGLNDVRRNRYLCKVVVS